MKYKKLSTEQLQYIFKDYDFKTSPMHHQLFSMAFAADRDRVCFFHGIGTGKSLCALYTHLVWETERVLIVCPNSVVQTTWIEQIEQHTNCSYTVLKGTREKRQKLLKEKSKFFIVNYEGLLPLFGNKSKEFPYNPVAIKEANFSGLIIDESQNTKSKETKHTKICGCISQNCRNVIIMTGTPIFKDCRELWSQYYVLDQGKTLGDNYWSFMNRYFYKYEIKLRRRPWKTTKWKMKVDSEEQILNRLRTNTIRVNREDCIDLPEIVEQRIVVDMTLEQKKVTRDIMDEIKSELLDTTNILSKSEKLRQVCGGFVYNDIGEGEKETILIKQNKTREVLGQIQQIKKVIIFHHYAAEGRILEDLCKKNGIKYASMRGEIKDKQNQYEKFKEDKSCKVLIAHPKSAGTGVNFQDVCQTIIFYSNETHLERRQCIGRIYRNSQKNKCLIIDIICKNSVDEIRETTIEEDAARAKKVLEYVKNF